MRKLKEMRREAQARILKKKDLVQHLAAQTTSNFRPTKIADLNSHCPRPA